MTLEKQVCSLELSKKLAELGVKQESLWCWANDYDTNYCICLSRSKTAKLGGMPYPAYTVTELGELLPVLTDAEEISILETYRRPYGLENETSFGVRLKGFDGRYYIEDTEADARAGMLVHLLENKLITL